MTESKSRRGGRLVPYKELLLFILFTVFCTLLAYSRGFAGEFWNTMTGPFLTGLILLFVVLPEFGGSRRIALVTVILMTLGSLIHAGLEVNYYHNESYKALRVDYILALIVILAVMIFYPLIARLMGSVFFIALAALLSLGILALLCFRGQAVNGATILLYGIPVIELIRILFILTIAGLLSKYRNRAGVLLSILYAGLVCGILAYLSEGGTMVVLGLVFLIFLFVYPTKMKYLAGLLVLAALLVVFLVLGGVGLYDRALEDSDPLLFASYFTDDSVGSGSTDRLKELILSYKDGEKTLADPAHEAAFIRAAEGLEGEDALTTDDFLKGSEVNSEVLAGELKKGTFDPADYEEYPAMFMLAELCEDTAFRTDFKETFLKNGFYDSATSVLYGSCKGFLTPVGHPALLIYNKLMSRYLLMALPESYVEAHFGQVNAQDMSFQVNRGARAMRLGGLTGSGSHEFISVPIMRSDMIFSELVSFFGFVMGLFVILMYMILFREGFRLQKKVGSGAPVNQGLVLGITLMIFIQAMVIIAGNIGIIPLTGITLPFIAEGSVSVIVFAAMAGILLAVSRMEIREDSQELDTFLSFLPAMTAGWFGRIFGGRLTGLVDMGSKLTDSLADTAAVDDDILEKDEDEDAFDDLEDLADLAGGHARAEEAEDMDGADAAEVKMHRPSGGSSETFAERWK